ncbi:MAG TPA: DUF4352 domain-containing protein [Candidatus Bathyarchaeia archaeon]|nr:DUF4352 domain-containing protein [Candidatus Bathyarchaeia archaeon]
MSEGEDIKVKHGNPFTSAFKGTLGKGCGCVTLIFLAIIGLVVISSGGKSSKEVTSPKKVEDGKQESSPEVVKEEKKKEVTIFKIGEEIDAGDYFITVKGARKSSGTIVPKAGNTYLLVDVLVENKTDEEKAVSSMLSSSVKDEEGVKYTITIGADNKGSLDGKLLPNDKLRGEVTFEVPKEATGFKYYFETGVFGGETVVVDLGI